MHAPSPHGGHPLGAERRPYGLILTTLRRMAIILVFVACLYLILPRLGGVGDGLRLARQADIPVLGLALACELLSVLAQAYVVHSALMIYGRQISFRRVFGVLRSAAFLILFVPSAGLSGHAFRLRHFGEQGYSTEASLLAYAVESVSQAAAMVLLVATAALQSGLYSGISPWRTLGALLGGVILGVSLLASLTRGLDRDGWVHRLLNRGMDATNWLRSLTGRSALTAEALWIRVEAFRAATRAINGTTRLRLLVGSIGRAAGEALCLHFTLVAMGLTLPLHATTAGYGLSVALGGVSSAPAGLAVTECSLSALLHQQGLTLSTALAATLLFRLLSLWIPHLLGMVPLLILELNARRRLW